MSPLDLHVLGTPPAFVLSQDQTLAFNPFYLYRCLHQQDANSFGITVSCLRYSCSVSFSRFSARRLACASRASLFILSLSQRNVNTFLQTFSLFCASFWICEHFPKHPSFSFAHYSEHSSLPNVRPFMKKDGAPAVLHFRNRGSYANPALGRASRQSGGAFHSAAPPRHWQQPRRNSVAPSPVQTGPGYRSAGQAGSQPPC